MRIGEIDIVALHDGTARIPPSAAYASGKGAAPADWEGHRQLLDHDGNLELEIGGFLVRSGDPGALVDAGVGRPRSGPFPRGPLLNSLAAQGLAPTDITDVLFTHLHFDHVGWSTQQGSIVFPNATYRCDERDWSHFVGPDQGATRKLSPLIDRIELWSRSGPLLPGIDVMAAPRHPPGSTIIVLASGTERAMLLGDVVHCPVELMDDEWAGMADVDSDLARRTRIALARELEGSDVPVAAAHFPGMRFGRLLRGEADR